MKRIALGIALAAASVFAPSLAHAHLVNSGLGPVYDGAYHLVMSPDDLLVVLAVALLAGLCGARASRLAVLSLPSFWFVAEWIGLGMPKLPEWPWVSALCLLIVGGLVALDSKLPAVAVALLAGLLGALHGLANGAALAASGAGSTSLLGIALTVLVIGLLVSALVVSLQKSWTRVAVRVAGSWVGAVGMLMLGWWVKRG
jgi:urease accessory protein